MKFCKISLFFALLVAVCLPAIGQNSLRVDIPFNFVASGKALPAGHYTVGRVHARSGSTWCISDDHNSALMLTSALDAPQTPHRPSLVFLRAGGTYSLVQIWNSYSGVDVPQMKVKQTLISKDDSKAGKYIEIGAE